MTQKVYREEAFAFYGERVNQLIPLNRWDLVLEGVERGKSPRDKEWRTKKYTSSAIEGAISTGCNLGYRLDERDLVVDMDPRNMEIEPHEAMMELGNRFGLAVAEAPCVKTGSGGYHLYFRIPDEWVGKKFINERPDLKGVEFKALGRQVVAVGSKHPNGTFYEAQSGDLSNIPLASVKMLAAIERPEIDQTIESRTLSNEELGELLAVLDPHDFNDNESWLKLAMSCHSATQGGGLQAFIDWSVQDSQYSDHHELIRTRWESFQSDGITAGTLYKHVIDSGNGEMVRPNANALFGEAELSQTDRALVNQAVQLSVQFDRGRDGKPKRTVGNVKIAIQNLGIIPRRNMLTQANYIEGSTDLLQEFFPEVATAVDDDLLHGIRAAITDHYHFEPSIPQVSEGLSAMALLRPWHPIKEYFSTLSWDGIDRIGGFFTRYCGSPQTEYTIAVAEVMLKAAVARVMRPGIKFDCMVILEGNQGCGKSTMVSILGGEWALEGLPQKSDLNHKDVIQQIQGHWIVEVEELAVMRKSDVDSMKAFLTRTTDKARFAYAREAKEYPRQCIFIGTTNDDEYLLDSTGNRRFLPIEVGQINLPMLAEDRDQIWAQAVQLWNVKPTPEALMLPASLWGDAAEEQSARRVQDPIEMRLSQFLKEHADRDFLRLEDVMINVLGKQPGQSDLGDMRRVTRAVQAIKGWKNGRREIEGESVKVVNRV